jgi:hypothetical protein
MTLAVAAQVINGPTPLWLSSVPASKPSTDSVTFSVTWPSSMREQNS